MAQGFPETRWTLIQKVRTEASSTEALEEWCQNYWPPVFSYVCAQGYDSEMARELTQTFFERLLSKGPEKVLPNHLSGAFRAYLMRSVKNFLTDHWRSQQSKRKGGGTHTVPEEQLENIGDQSAHPDRAFDQSWALTILNLAMQNLENEMASKGRSDFFHAAKSLLDGRSVTDEDRQALAQSLDMQDGAFRVALHRLRGRFRQLIEAEVRETVSSEEEFQEELGYLFSVWS
ncbi:MAG: RNA polymerase sigma factor [Roseibacillus sp.]